MPPEPINRYDLAPKTKCPGPLRLQLIAALVMLWPMVRPKLLWMGQQLSVKGRLEGLHRSVSSVEQTMQVMGFGVHQVGQQLIVTRAGDRGKAAAGARA